MIEKIAYLVGLKITSGFSRGNVRMDSIKRQGFRPVLARSGVSANGSLFWTRLQLFNI